MFACDIGDVATSWFYITNRGGTFVDPSEVLLYLAMPSGSVGTYTYSGGAVQHQATGTFYYNGTATESGYWNARWVGTGAADAAQQSRYFVREINT